MNEGSLLKDMAILISTGFRLFNARRKEEYGYGIYENVITSVELENYFTNHRIETSTGQIPQRIGLIQCVGSRDEKICNFHCSKLCCITAVKQAIELRELLPEAEILCFTWICVCSGPVRRNVPGSPGKIQYKFVRGRLSEAAEIKKSNSYKTETYSGWQGP